MAGLVVNGFQGPWRWNNLDWELPFYKVWRDWAPQQREPQSFPRFELAGTRFTSQAREMLWQLKSTSPFQAFQTEALPVEPRGLDPVDYLEIYAEGAEPEEWIALAAAFLKAMEEKA
ncbi:hypothetical protein CVCC1112_4268 [Paenarthrobacter nicotinovorans]|nr:hypothetical protein CVCC1112_4268 [Paenarthrobacter nicotinovorans]